MKPRKTIFTRILAASLLPFAVVFLIILFIASNIISNYSENRVRENVVFFAKHASEKITYTLKSITQLVQLTANGMVDVVANTDHARTTLDSMLHALMRANPEIYCAWYVFESGVASSEPGWYIKTYLKREGQIALAPSETQEQLDDPGFSPWHTQPYRTGEPYLDAVEYWDYGVGDGVEFAGTIAYPVISNGKIIGTLGIDILYENAFTFMDEWQIPDQRKIMLFASDGTVLYSQHDQFKRQNYHSLGFDPRDAEDFAAAIKANIPLIKEIESPLHHEKSLISLNPVDIPNAVHKIFLYLDQPTSILYSNAQRMIYSILGISLAGLVVIAATTFIATRGIIRPIKEITAFAKRVANGDRDMGSEQFGDGDPKGNEVDALRHSLGLMLNQIDQNNDLRMYAMEANFEKNKSEETTRERTQFFSNIAHEFLGPMNAIMGISELMQTHPLDPEQLQRARDIQSSAETLQSTINDILDISQLEAGTLNLAQDDFDFRRMVAEVGKTGKRMATAKNLAFKLETEGELPRYVRGDARRLRQILINLVDNAVKATDMGSVVLRVAANASDLFFNVADNGIGLRDDEHEALFDAFKQVDAQRAKRGRRTGLGLAVSLNLVKQMGGEIGVDSEFGKGNVFHVRLPLVQGDEERARRGAAQTSTMVRARARVLVVDDSVVNLRVAQGLIGLHGVICDTALSGEEALGMVERKEYDLVFMDHMMPGMDGVETALHIRALGKHNLKVPIIALTANAMSETRNFLLESGMSDFLPKPIERGTLNAILARWLPPEKLESTGRV